MATLSEKMSDMDHPMTRILVEIHSLREQKFFKRSNDEFAQTLVRALKKSQTEEHYLAMYALWDDAPFRDVSRMVIRMVFNLIKTSYNEAGGGGG